MKITCAQRGCVFEAEEMPDNCAVCNNPLPGATSQDDDDELTWLDYTVEELRQQATDWDLEGWNKRSTKAELIELLEQFEAASEGDDD